MSANFKRVEKLILEGGGSYLPVDWEGKNNMLNQEELFDHIIMYILKLDLVDDIPEEAWYTQAETALDDYAFWYASDIFDDLSIFYEYKNLMDDIEVEAYKKPEKMRKIYEIYMESTNENQPSAFYKKIYEFVDECLRDDTWLED